MKRFAGLIVLCCLALALPAGAQLACTEPDLFALVGDAGFMNHTPTVGVPFNLHAVLLNPSAQPIDAFEFRLNLPTPTGQLFVLQETLPPGSINVGNNGVDYREYIVGFPTPRPASNNRIELVSFSLMCLASTPNQDFTVQPISTPSIPGSLAYNETKVDSAVLHAMTPVSGSFALPVARLFPSTPLSYCEGAVGEIEVRIDVSAAAGGVRDPLARAGTAVSATLGFDIDWERPEPALPPSNYISACFWHDEWPLGPRFNHDIRAPFDPTAMWVQWPLVIETDRDDLVTVTFAPNFTADGDMRLHLLDVERAVRVPLFPHLTYTYRNHGLPTARELRIFVGGWYDPPISPTARTILPGWSLVSLPLAPRAGLGTVGATLLDPAPGYAFAYTHDPAIGYVPATADQPVALGQGYWLGTTDAYQIAASGTKARDGAVIATAPGWNLVGYPCWFADGVNGIVVEHDGDSMRWLAAVQAGLVSPDVQGYSTVTGQYYDATLLYPFQAYWINVLAPGIRLVISSYGMENAKSALKVDPRPDITRDSWRTDLTLADAAGRERVVTLGVDPAGTAGFDSQLDRPQPPAAPVPGPDFCLLHPEWSVAAGPRFTRDITGPTTGPLSWSLTLTSPVAGAGTLSWDTKAWPDELDLELFLPGENRVLLRSMRARSSVNVNLGSGPVTVVVRTPEQAAGVGDLPGAPTGHLSVHPNPFNPQATLTFSLPHAARAEVRIYSLRGELVRVLGGPLLAAGPQQLTWDGADMRGRAMPSGSYFGRLHLDGAISGPTVRMSLVR